MKLLFLEHGQILPRWETDWQADTATINTNISSNIRQTLQPATPLFYY